MKHPFHVPLYDDKPLWDIWGSMYHLALLGVADELHLFEALESQALSLPELARKLEIGFRAAETVTSVLAGLNFLKKEAGKINLTEQAKIYLLPGSPFYWGALFKSSNMREEHKALRIALKHDGNPFSAYGKSFTDDWTQNSISLETARMFADLMHGMIFAPAVSAVKNEIFSHTTRLLDVGGGAGSFGIAFAYECPQSRATVFDLPPVCKIAQEYIQKFNVNERVDVYPGNFFADLWPRGYDGICFSNIFHDWPPDRCRTLAASAYDALEPGGRIFLHEMLLDDEKFGPLAAACFDLWMFVNFSAQQYSQDELFHVLADAGFEEPGVLSTFGYYSVVHAVKPG
ncbi:MAG: methyltransferase [bacterium]|nr:methyltransferase [bacterium]